MPAAYRSTLRSGWHGAIALFTSHNRPGDQCHLVGDSDSDQTGWFSLQQLICPDAGWYRTTAVAPTTRRCRRQRSPIFDMPIRCLPPDECSFGTSPSQAANCRPERNTFASLMVAASAVAVMKPMPGIVSSRWQVGSARCQAMLGFAFRNPCYRLKNSLFLKILPC